MWALPGHLLSPPPSSLSAVFCILPSVSLRLIALSAQRFIFSVAEDAQQLSRLRSRQAADTEVKVPHTAPDPSTSHPLPRPALTHCWLLCPRPAVQSSELTMEDLSVALSYQGIAINKPPYYADHLDTSH